MTKIKVFEAETKEGIGFIVNKFLQKNKKTIEYVDLKCSDNGKAFFFVLVYRGKIINEK